MPFIPDQTSPEALGDFSPAQRLLNSEGDAWRDVHLSLYRFPDDLHEFRMPGVNEPYIVWIQSGAADTWERIEGGEWQLAAESRAGTLYITGSCEPYDFRWQRRSDDDYELLLVSLSPGLFTKALQTCFGGEAVYAELQDCSVDDDAVMVNLLSCLQDEAQQLESNSRYVAALAEALAIHLARRYTHQAACGSSRQEAASRLPTWKLRRVINWMQDHLDEEFNLARLADQVDLSEFHFNRLFKRATGLPPSQYQIRLRIEQARKLLRETDFSVLEIANHVGYSNPSHFAALFKKHVGVSPSVFRQPG
ncbi:helix-turn-helix domain-containing protein [Oceanobacter kriegii]|uniref:helix-turn-helix domain-containing protein n=1 Tax=Oceanobacter kriegii TaxID=64972 RepID=UPI000426173D|nr:AraC family transcriptional regulator [Oceanobacter kriegii]